MIGAIASHYVASAGIGTVSFVSQASSGQAAPLTSVPMPTSFAAGDMLLAIIAAKHYAAVPSTVTSGWSETITGANGSVASGPDVGSVRGAVFQKTAVGSDGSPAFTFSPSGNTAVAKTYAFRKDSGTWSIAATQGSDADATGTTLSATGDATLDVQAGDMVAWTVAFPTDAPGTASRVVSIPGCTGTTTLLGTAPVTTLNDDCAALLGYFTVTAGTSSGPPTFTCTTDSGQSSGLVSFVRLRAAL